MQNRNARLNPWRLAVLCVSGVLLLVPVWLAVRYREALAVALLPFLISLVLAYLLSPVIFWMEQKRISRSAAIIALYLVFSVIILVFCLRVMPTLLDDLQDLAKELPRYTMQLQKQVDHLQEHYRSFNLPPSAREIIDRNIAGMEQFLNAQLEQAYRLLLDWFGRVLLLLLVPILTYYLLRDEELLKKWVMNLFPAPARDRFRALCEEINRILGAFIRGTVLVSLVVGLLYYAMFVITGLNFPLILAFIGGVTNLIPLVGPVIGAVPALLVAILDSPVQVLRVLILITVIQQVESQFIYPSIIGRCTGFHPLVVILALLIGAKLYGFAGLLLAMPAAIILRIVTEHLLEAWQD